MNTLEKFFEQDETIGEAVHDKLAKLLNGGLRRKPNEDAVLNLSKKYTRPQNIPGLEVPKQIKLYGRDCARDHKLLMEQYKRSRL